MKETRRKEMEALIAAREAMTMEDLQAAFGVSMNTIRSDVAYLAESGAVTKVYGGVRAVAHQSVPQFIHRAEQNTEVKRRIAQQAEKLIADGDVLFLDAGTTTMHLIHYLHPDKHVVILTNNLYIISQAFRQQNVELIVPSGAADRRTNAIADGSTLDFLSRYRYTKAFMGASGVSADGRLNVSTYIACELKKQAIRQAGEAYLLADAGKFGSAGLMSYGMLEDMARVVTDERCPEQVRRLCQSRNLPLTLV